MLSEANAPVYPMRLTPQPSADALFVIGDKSYGVERKEASDLLNSWVSKHKCKAQCDKCGGKGCYHLASQLERMLTNFDHTILVIEGWFGINERGYVQTAYGDRALLWRGVMNMLYKWQERGVRLQFTANTQHTAQQLVALREYLS